MSGGGGGGGGGWLKSALQANLLCDRLTHTYRVRISNCDVKVNIFDMAGQPFFYEVSNSYVY